MQRLAKKILRLIGAFDDLRNDLFLQSLPPENQEDYHRARYAMKTFFDNLPQKEI